MTWVSASELLEPSRHEHPVLGLVLRLLQQRRAHRGRARGDEQRQRRAREREHRHDPEYPPRQTPQSDPPRSERDHLAVSVETAEADEHREVERERKEHRELLDELQGEDAENHVRRHRARRRVGEDAREPIRPVDQDEHREHHGAGAQHFTAEVAFDDQGAVAGTDGQLPRALTTLPAADSDTFGHSRGVDRDTPHGTARDGRHRTRWYQTPCPAFTRGGRRAGTFHATV